MSTKTLRKRIALVAVAALGAGVLSVAPASAATSGFTYAEFDFSLALSQRVCKDITDQDGEGDSNLTKVGEVLSNGTLHFAGASTVAFDSAVGDSFTVQLTGPAVFGTVTQDATVPATPVYSGTNGTTLTFLSSADRAAQLPTVISVSATGAGVIQVSFTRTDGTTSTDLETYTFASVASCSSGVANVGNSFIRTMFYGSDGTLGSATSPASNVTEYTAADTTAGSASLKDSADRIANGGTARVAMRVMDGATTPAVITTAGVFSASATNGAVIGWDTTALALQSSSATEAVSAGAQANVLYVTQGLANKDKPMSTVVTLYYNGVEYGKRTITFTGKPSKLVINADDSSAAKSNNATNLLAGSYSILDAAGNDLTASGEGVGVSTDVVNSPLLITASYAVIVDSAKDVVTDIGSVGTEADEENGYFGWTCGAVKGTAKIYLKYIMADTTTLVSNTYDAACYGGAVNYKASLDKASYAPGEIATLTITATDSAGNPVYDVNEAGVGVDLGTLAKSPEISLPSLTAVSTPTWSDEFSAGKKTYKFTVGATEGTFQGVVNLPNINNTTYAQVAQTIGYKVAGSAGVTNADVLKAIVSLIASINKQIAALQKALLKK